VKKRMISALAAMMLALGLMIGTIVPAEAVDRIVFSNPRTIYSTNRSTSLTWAMQIWQETPRPGPCWLFGRSIMYNESGPLNPVAILEWVDITDLTTGRSTARGGPRSGRPPIAIITPDSVAIPANQTHTIRVDGNARVNWSASDHGPRGYHRAEARIHCYPVPGTANYTAKITAVLQ
jgi:hypothetical protein